MIDEMAVGTAGRGWSAVGGRVLTPASESRTRGGAASPRPVSPLNGRVSLATSDGLLGPARRLRYRRVKWVRFAAVWAALVFLMPLAAGWAWGLVG